MWVMKGPAAPRSLSVAALLVLLTLLPLWSADGTRLLGPKGAAVLVSLGGVLGGLWGLFTVALRSDAAAQRARGVFLVLVLGSLAILNAVRPGAEQMPALFACVVLGLSLPGAWLRVLGVPLVALVLWLVARTEPLTPSAVMTNAIGLAGLLYLGYGIRRQRELSQRLEQANRELARQVEQDAELARLRERERLARELHDTLGHALSTLTVQIEAGRRLTRKNPERADTQLSDAQVLARQAMRDLRASLDDLRGSEEGATLREALTALSADFTRRNGWSVQNEFADVRLPPQSVAALTRAAREALVNIERHADARQVTLTLREQDVTLVLIVTDDGRGFDPTAVPAGHYGLRGLRERLALLGGDARVDSTLGAGTRVTLTLPLHAERLPERIFS